MPLLPLLLPSMDMLQVQTTATFSCFCEWFPLITSVKGKHQECIIFFCRQHVCISACLLDTISSSSSKTKLKPFSSFTSVFLYGIASSFWRLSHLRAFLPQGLVRWHPVLRFYPSLCVFSLSSFPEPSTVPGTEEAIRASLYVSYWDVSCGTQFQNVLWQLLKTAFIFSFWLLTNICGGIYKKTEICIP